ncbi:MAG: nickel pincer cofactor biosynthesis protein LarB [SAR202 cluster bacterium]|nr:nickel pincer cofactor biosynthesis protein LarB [SAR202 cluster bacterium]
MDTEKILELLENVRNGTIQPADAATKLRQLPYQDLDFASLDHHRALRTGFPEVVYGEGKTIPQLITITQNLASQSDQILVTRVTQDIFKEVQQVIPDLSFNEAAQSMYIDRNPGKKKDGVTIVSAGTADLPVAEEAALTAQMLGNHVERFIDIGVAGLHRLLDKLEALQKANVVVVVAGMEGALPSVVAGLIPSPVIAIPTSVGYGAHFDGLAPLLSMLNSCATGVAVVNIDNGFGGGFMAGIINQQTQ